MIQDLQQFEETMAKAKTDPEVPPLAVWMMETLAERFKRSTACTHLNLCVRTKAFTPDEPSECDALFSLHGVDTRAADVWVEWSEDETVTVSIITSHGVGAEHVSSVSRWSPHLLVSWLDGASWVSVIVEEAKPAAQFEALATATEGLLDEHAKLQAEHVEMLRAEERRRAYVPPVLRPVPEFMFDPGPIVGARGDDLLLLREGRRLAIDALSHVLKVWPTLNYLSETQMADAKQSVATAVQTALEFLTSPPSRQRRLMAQDSEPMQVRRPDLLPRATESVNEKSRIAELERERDAAQSEARSLGEHTLSLERQIGDLRKMYEAADRERSETADAADSLIKASQSLTRQRDMYRSRLEPLVAEVESLKTERGEVEQLLSSALYWPSGFSGDDGRNVKARAQQVFERVKKQHGFEQRVFMLLSERVLGRERAEKVFAAARVERPAGASDRCDRCGSLVRVPGPYVCGKCEPFSWLGDAEAQRAEFRAQLLTCTGALELVDVGESGYSLPTYVRDARALLAKYPEAR